MSRPVTPGPSRMSRQQSRAQTPAPSGEHIKVIVRCRPCLTEDPNERNDNMMIDTTECSIRLKEEGFDARFDAVLPPSTSQQEVYETTARPIIDSVLQGFNGTVFAYGLTGSGKTYTMMGPGKPSKEQREAPRESGSLNLSKSDGIIPRAIQHLFDRIKEEQAAAGDSDEAKATRYLVRASFVEIYNRKIFDLFAADKEGGGGEPESLQLKGDGQQVYVDGLSWREASSAVDLRQLLSLGRKNQHVRGTLMNLQSSRSHSIFTVVVESSFRSANSKATHVRVGKLNLVDLAGSENVKQSGATGDGLKEATEINTALSTLANVIHALNHNQGHVPYRDSKLTRMLQDSLGGNAKTVMVANINPERSATAHTLNSLRFAYRVTKVTNKPKINIDPKDAKIREYEEEIEKLRRQLEDNKGEDSASLARSSIGPDQMEAYQTQLLDRLKEVENFFIGQTQSSVAELRKSETIMIDQIEANREKELNRMKAAFEANLKMKEEIVTSLRSQETTLQQTIETLRGQLAVSKEQVSVLASEKEQQKSQFETLVSMLKEQLQREEAAKSSAAQDLQAKSQQIESIKDQISALQKNHQEETDGKAKLLKEKERELEAERYETAKLKNLLADKERDHDAKESQLKEAGDSRVVELTAQLAAERERHRLEKEHLEALLKAARSELASQQEDRQRTESALRAEIRDLHDAKSELEGRMKEDLSQMNASKQSVEEGLRESLKEARENANRDRQEREALHKQVETLGEEKYELAREKVQARVEIEELQGKLKVLQTDLEVAERCSSSLKEEVTGLREELEEANRQRRQEATRAREESEEREKEMRRQAKKERDEWEEEKMIMEKRAAELQQEVLAVHDEKTKVVEKMKAESEKELQILNDALKKARESSESHQGAFVVEKEELQRRLQKLEREKEREVEDLQSSLDNTRKSLEGRIREVEELLSSSEQEKRRLEEECRGVRRRMEEQEASVVEAKELNARSLERWKTSANLEVNELQSQLSKVKEESAAALSKIQEERAALSAKIGTLESHVASLESERTRTEARHREAVETLTEEREEARTSLRRLREASSLERETAEKRVTDLLRQLQTALDDKQSSTDNLKAQAGEELASLRKSLATEKDLATAETARLHAVRTQLEEENGRLEEKCKELKRHTESLEEKLQDATKTIHKAQVESSEKRAELESRLRSAEKETSQLEERLSKLSKEKETAEDQLVATQRQLRTKTEEIDAMHGQLAESRSQRETVQAEASSARERLTELESRLASLHSQEKSLTSDLSARTEAEERLRSRLKETEGELETMRTQLKETSEALHEAQRTERKQRAQEEELQETLRTTRTETSQVVEERKVLKATVETLTAEKNALEEKVSSLTATVKSLEATVTDLSAQCEERGARASHLFEELESLRREDANRLLSFEETQARLQKKLTTMKTKLDRLQTPVDSLVREIEAIPIDDPRLDERINEKFDELVGAPERDIKVIEALFRKIAAASEGSKAGCLYRCVPRVAEVCEKYGRDHSAVVYRAFNALAKICYYKLPNRQYVVHVDNKKTVQLLLELMDHHAMDAKVQQHACKLFTILALEEHAKRVESVDFELALRLVLKALHNHPRDPDVFGLTCHALAALTAQGDATRSLLLKEGGLGTAVESLRRHGHLKDKKACNAVSQLVYSLCLREDLGKHKFVEAGGVEALISCLEYHSDFASLVKFACLALNQMLSTRATPPASPILSAAIKCALADRGSDLSSILSSCGETLQRQMDLESSQSNEQEVNNLKAAQKSLVSLQRTHQKAMVSRDANEKLGAEGIETGTEKGERKLVARTEQGAAEIRLSGDRGRRER